MARIDVLMPQMGESIAEGTLSKWLKKVGDAVKRDEPLFEISTDKVDAEIPAPAAGVLAEIKVQEGQTVPVQTIVARIETEVGAAIAAEPVAASVSASAAAPVATPAAASASVSASVSAPASAGAGGAIAPPVAGKIRLSSCCGTAPPFQLAGLDHSASLLPDQINVASSERSSRRSRNIIRLRR